MMISLVYLASSLFSLLVYRLVSTSLRQRRFRTFAKANGCEEPYNDDQGVLPWNIERMYGIVTARRKGKEPLDDYFTSPLLAHPTLQRTGLGGKKDLETIEPENIKAIFATKFNDWVIGDFRQEAFRPVFGTNIINSDGASWEHSRAMFRPQFSRELINNLEGTEQSVSTLFEAIGPVDGKGWTEMKDMLPLFCHFVMDNSTEFLFGESVGAQRAYMQPNAGSGQANPETRELGDLAGGKEYAEAFDICSYYMVLRIRLQAFIRFGDSKEFRQAIETVRRVSGHYVRQALAAKRDDRKGRRFDLLSNLAEHTRDVTELEDQTLGILFASRDTTSFLLVWTLLLLGQHPEVFRKLRTIVLETFPQPLGEVLDSAQLKACRYLQHVLRESLRVYQVAPLTSRVAVRDTVLPVGGGRDGSKPVAVRKGQQVLLNFYAMHRRKDIWGEDAEEFVPERWEAPKQGRALGGFTPFGAGPRTCLGREFSKGFNGRAVY